LSENNEAGFIKTRVHFLFGGFIQHWGKPLHHCLSTLNKGREYALEYYDFEYAALIHNLILFQTVATGKNLQYFLDTKKEHFDYYNNISYSRSIIASQRTYFFINNLTDQTISTFSFTSEDLNEQSALAKIIEKEDNSAIASFYTYKLCVHYYYHDYSGAAEYINKAEPYLAGLLGQFTLIWYLWFSVLTEIKLYAVKPERTLLRSIKKRLRKLRIIACNSPENHSHRLFLAEAELFSVRHKSIAALKKYELAIQAAHTYGFIQDEALIWEKASEHLYSCKKNELSGVYLTKAYQCYSAWGATRKLKQMAEKYPSLGVSLHESQTTTSLSKYVSNIVDTAGIISASQAISENIDRESLTAAILKTVMQHSGADSGVLYAVNPDSTYSILAKAEYNDKEKFIAIIKADTEKEISHKIKLLDYIRRTAKAEIISGLHKLVEFGLMSSEEDKLNKSVLCFPIIHTSRIVGIIYLENNHLAEVFSEKNLEVLKFLAGQIAISLENSRLYESLKQSYESLQESREQNQLQFQQLVQAEKLSSLGLLAAAISHEVSNPNYAVYLNAEFLENSEQDFMALLNEYSPELDSVQINGISFSLFKQKFPTVVQTILKCSKQIDSVVKELKNYTKRDSNSGFELIDLNEIVNSVIVLSQGYIEKATDCFILNLDNTVPRISGKAQKLQQVFMNLIINACQALPSRAKKLQIESGADYTAEHVYLKIVDEGCGIKEEHRSDITKPFFSTKDSLGFGLSISSEIIAAHQGSLEFINNEPAGTIAAVYLPFSKEKLS